MWSLHTAQTPAKVAIHQHHDNLTKAGYYLSNFKTELQRRQIKLACKSSRTKAHSTVLRPEA